MDKGSAVIQDSAIVAAIGFGFSLLLFLMDLILNAVFVATKLDFLLIIGALFEILQGLTLLFSQKRFRKKDNRELLYGKNSLKLMTMLSAFIYAVLMLLIFPLIAKLIWWILPSVFLPKGLIPSIDTIFLIQVFAVGMAIIIFLVQLLKPLFFAED